MTSHRSSSDGSIDVLASEPHFADHLAAVWGSLPPHARGRFVLGHPSIATRESVAGIPTTAIRDWSADRPTLVASVGDLHRAAKAGAAELAIMEHGAGQSYGGHPTSARQPSYAGGHKREAASLFLHPNEHAAGRDRAAYPRARVEVVGSPFLDTMPAAELASPPIVALAWHFDGAVAPETRTAFPHYRQAIQRLALEGRVELLGHAHPRIRQQLDPWYTRHGIEVAASFDDVVRRASVLVADNTSAMFAFAATDRPVVVLNAPWYRRDVQHGLRFWSAADVGIQVDDPRQLEPAIAEALADGPARQAARDAALDQVYAYRTGAARRAASVLVDWVGEYARRAA